MGSIRAPFALLVTLSLHSWSD